MKKLLLLIAFTCLSVASYAIATVTQKEWRWRNDNGSETSATWRAAQNQTASMTVCAADTLRLRMVFQVNPNTSTSNPSSLTTASGVLSYAASPSGPWVSFTAANSNFRMVTTTRVAGGTPTTQQLSSTGGTYAQGYIIDAGNSGNGITFSTPASVTTLTEYEWVFMPNANVLGQTYYFRLDGVTTYNSPMPSIAFSGATTSTQNVSTCGASYTSPSGSYTWTASGTYNDTLTNSVGCDSVIVTNLTLRPSTASTISVTACDSYISPSGQTFTASGTYNDTIPNAAGCDSVITVNLTINAGSMAMIMATACDSYTSPSGQTFTASGTYLDVIPNAAGCDSIITIMLTINNSTASMQTVTVCDSYTSPSGQNYTTSGTYLDVIPNTAGCDSIITIMLTVNSTTMAMQNVTACDTYTSPSGQTYTASGTYLDIIPNAAGCDSIITIMLTINNSTMAMQTVTTCDSYISPGGQNLTVSGTYLDVIPNAAGCDSMITIMLTILNSTSSVQMITHCGTYTSPSGQTFNTSGLYLDIIPNTAGCDSMITIDLTIINSTTSTQTIAACNSFSSPSGTYVWTASGTYTDIITNAAGCDSVITFNLTINSVNPAVTVSNNTITASEPNAVYQWIDCGNNNTPIAGATGQSYTPSANGHYAVIVTNNGCSELSLCVNISSIGLADVSAGQTTLALYPNPSNGSFTLQAAAQTRIEIYNSAGQLVEARIITAGTHVMEMQNLDNGIYTLTSIAGNGVRTSQRFIIAK